eukprot:2275118-Amphidinium_carterae.1
MRGAASLVKDLHGGRAKVASASMDAQGVEAFPPDKFISSSGDAICVEFGCFRGRQLLRKTSDGPLMVTSKARRGPMDVTADISSHTLIVQSSQFGSGFECTIEL